MFETIRIFTFKILDSMLDTEISNQEENDTEGNEALYEQYADNYSNTNYATDNGWRAP